MNKTLLHYTSDQPVTVSFICRNKKKNFKFILDAFEKNTRVPDFFVLADDSSDDGSVEEFERICSEKGFKHKVLTHEHDGRLYRINQLRNEGIQAALDGLVILLDADLVPSRTFVEAHVELHEKHRDKKVISTGPRLEYAHEDCTGPINFMWGFEPIGLLQESETEPVMDWTTIPGSMVGLTKGAAEDVGWYDAGFDGNYGYCDNDFMYRASKKGYFFAASFEAYSIHIPHSSFPNVNYVNRDLFIEKNGFEFKYPAIVYPLCREEPWSSFYNKMILPLKGQQKNLGNTYIQWIDNIPIKMLVGFVIQRVLKRIFSFGKRSKKS